MTPQERQLVSDLFERLATLEGKPRDPDAERLIAQGLHVAPHAVYALVQTVLVQDQALREADARMRELDDGGEPQGDDSFLVNMRDALFGSSQERRGPVPNVRRGGFPRPDMGRPEMGSERRPMQPEPQSQGPSFLGTAAASAAGVIGGALLLDSFRSMMGGGQSGSTFGDTAAASPWGGSSNDSLARDAGVNDIGRGDDRAGERDQAGLYDNADQDPGADDLAGGDFDFGDSDFS